MYLSSIKGLLETFKTNNKLLDEIQKCLEEYLTAKRLVFPRLAEKSSIPICTLCISYIRTYVCTYVFGRD